MEYNRGRAPAPLTIENPSGGASARRQDSFGSDASDQEKELARSAPSSHWFGEHRRGPDRRTLSMSAPAKPASPTVNLYTHCGRHSDQYLFGGWTDLIRSTFKKE